MWSEMEGHRVVIFESASFCHFGLYEYSFRENVMKSGQSPRVTLYLMWKYSPLAVSMVATHQAVFLDFPSPPGSVSESLQTSTTALHKK